MSSADRDGLAGNSVQVKVAEKKCVLWPIVDTLILSGADTRQQYFLKYLSFRFLFNVKKNTFIMSFELKLYNLSRIKL